jgi:hypothetical protein
MIAHELFATYSPGEAGEVFTWLYENDKAAYKTTVGMLATRRKLRPIFVERKPRDERHAWMREALSRPANADLATEILQAWILGAQAGLVCHFLDALNVPHDGNGMLEELPAEPDRPAVEAAIDGLFAKYPAVAARTYLNLFSSMDMTEWPGLRALVKTDSRLCPKPPTP